MRPDGTLVLYTISSELVYEFEPYFNSCTYDRANKGNSSQSLGYGDLGNLYIRGDNGSIVYNLSEISNFQYPKMEFYYRATLDFDGYFRKYAYPKTGRNGSSSSTTQSWIRIWYVPHDICTSSVGQLGGGSCGFNAY